MIETVADLLHDLVEAERILLNAEKITHRPTIGAMWENLSREVLERAIPFKGLAVSSGFIQGETGDLSAELDCVLVNGTGRQIHRNEKRIFRPNEVIAIIQVKKTLYKKDVKEGFDNLESILRINEKWEIPAGHSVRRAFQIIARTPLPEDTSTLPPMLKHLYHSLVAESVLPCRIILGYYGFKTEKTFRQGLLDYFNETASEPGWGPAGYPGFIIGPNAVAIKNTAMPWGSPIVDGWWPLILTNGTMKPTMCLLEAIWTRLNYLGLMSCEFFGEDLELEGLTPLIDVKLIDETSWDLHTRTSDLDETEYPEEAFQWSPTFVDAEGNTLVVMMAQCDPEPLDISEINDDPKFAIGIKQLEDAGIAGRLVSNPMRLAFLTSCCNSVILPDGRFAVA